MSKTATRGSPVPNGVQLAPPSVELYTPMSVPAKRLFEFAGSTAKALIGMLGMPFPAAVQMGDGGGAPGAAAAPRFVIFQTPCPVGAKNEKAMYATSLLFGSITARPTNRLLLPLGFVGNDGFVIS